MSTALITALRESCGYLRDGGYRETARLVVLAADEIERLNERVRLLESGASAQVLARERRTAGNAAPGSAAPGNAAPSSAAPSQIAGAAAADLPPARRSVSANR